MEAVKSYLPIPGMNQDFRDAVHFWLTVLVYLSHDSILPDVETFFAQYLEDDFTFCQEISCERFCEIVHRYDFVVSDHDFSPHGQFCQAWRVFDAGIGVAVVAVLAETDSEFAVFYHEVYD
jgi:hypothetical protein